MEIMFKIFEGLKREGPGSFAMTKRALDLCTLPENPKILELGCGTGGATIPLAQLSGGVITATDVHRKYLDRLMQRAREAGVADRVEALVMDMADVQAEREFFDAVWCEGAAYIMGVDRALSSWRQFIRPGGYLCFSDAVWVTSPVDAPRDLRDHWAREYPAMRTAEENNRAAEAAGYGVLGDFLIDKTCWEDFYTDVEKRLATVEPMYGKVPEGRTVINATRLEIDIYRHYFGAYGFSFHILQKRSA